MAEVKCKEVGEVRMEVVLDVGLAGCFGFGMFFTYIVWYVPEAPVPGVNEKGLMRV